MGVELMDSSVIWYAVLAVVVVALVFVLFNFNKVKKMKEGNDEMVEMAGIIRSGAGTFLKAEFKVIAIIGVIIALVFSLFVEATSGITFLLGGLMSSLVCIIGMKSATYANVRTANKARESLSIGETVKVALSGGSVSGIAVQAFGMLGLLLGCGSSRNRSRTGGKPGVQSFHHENHYILSGMFNRSHVQQGCRW